MMFGRWLQSLRSRSAGFHPARTPRGRLFLAIAALSMMIALVAPLFHDPVDRSAMPVRDGIADFIRGHAFDKHCVRRLGVSRAAKAKNGDQKQISVHQALPTNNKA